MLLIWKGWGVVVIGIAFVALVVGVIISTQFNADARWSDWILGLTAIAAGVGTWFLGKRMNRNAVRELVDPKTGEAVTVRGGHSLFFIPVQWWGPVMVVIGAYLLVAGVLV